MPNIFKKLNMIGADVWYCPNFFSDSHEMWYEMIDTSVNWQKFEVMVFGKKHPQPRDSFYMADNGYPYKYSGIDRKPDKWTMSVTEMKKEVEFAIREFVRPDHPPLNACLGNRYNNGKDNIGAHSDSEGDLDPNAYIVSVSLGAAGDFIVTHKKTKQKVKILLEPGSIILMGGDCQKNWKHAVPKRLRVKDPRINLTFRCVLSRILSREPESDSEPEPWSDSESNSWCEHCHVFVGGGLLMCGDCKVKIESTELPETITYAVDFNTRYAVGAPKLTDENLECWLDTFLRSQHFEVEQYYSTHFVVIRGTLYIRYKWVEESEKIRVDLDSSIPSEMEESFVDDHGEAGFDATRIFLEKIDCLISDELKEDSPIIMHILEITTNDDKDDEKISQRLQSKSLDGLKYKYRIYLKQHREDEDYLEDDEWKSTVNTMVDTVTSPCAYPEFNCAFFVKYHVLKDDGEPCGGCDWCYTCQDAVDGGEPCGECGNCDRCTNKTNI